jgi:hypothetical protein
MIIFKKNDKNWRWQVLSGDRELIAESLDFNSNAAAINNLMYLFIILSNEIAKFAASNIERVEDDD